MICGFVNMYIVCTQVATAVTSAMHHHFQPEVFANFSGTKYEYIHKYLHIYKSATYIRTFTGVMTIFINKMKFFENSKNTIDACWVCFNIHTFAAMSLLISETSTNTHIQTYKHITYVAQICLTAFAFNVFFFIFLLSSAIYLLVRAYFSGSRESLQFSCIPIPIHTYIRITALISITSSKIKIRWLRCLLNKF